MLHLGPLLEGGGQSLQPQNRPFGGTDYFKLVIFKKPKTKEDPFISSRLKGFG